MQMISIQANVGRHYESNTDQATIYLFDMKSNANDFN